MGDLDVRVVRLEPMRVASVRAISIAPERDAWKKMRAWAEPKGLLRDVDKHPVFGFNNPSPFPGRKEYGYEFWIRVDPDAESEGEIEVKDVGGGLYAVTTCNELATISEAYEKLWRWVQSSKYQWRLTHELEKPQNPGAAEGEIVLDLYLPIEE